ncbi:MAG: hypothetical protein AB1714_21225 [Acidobacteriota bacterium]
MKSNLKKLLCCFSVIALSQMNPAYGQSPAVDDLIEYINLRMSRSSIERIAEDGLVSIKAPDDTFKFDIKEASFNYNGLNDDARVRVFCEYCIGQYDGGHLEETSHRQSFLCKSEKYAREVIDAFRRLRKSYVERDKGFETYDAKIDTGPTSSRYKSVTEAIDFINEIMTISAIMKVDRNGRMLINAPDDIYDVQIKEAEFGFNDLGDEPQVRVYGEWCISLSGKDRGRVVSRESFQVASSDGAYQTIRALYFIKSAFTGMDAATVNNLKAVTGTRTKSYSTIPEAVDYINDRLKYSILMRVNDKGVALMNSMENTFLFDVRACKFGQGHATALLKSLLNLFDHESEEALVVECHGGIGKYEDGRRTEPLDKQSFQCRSESDVKDVIKAFEFIQARLGKEKGA